MPIMYCNLVKTQAFPLVSRVSSSQPKCFKPSQRFKTQSFSDGLYPKSSKTIQIVKPMNFTSGFSRKGVENDGWVEMKTRTFSCGFHFRNSLESSKIVRSRSFSSSSPPKVVEGDNGVKSRRNLPWIAAAYKNKRGRSTLKPTPKGTSRSTWEESAKNFLLENGVEEPVENMESRTRTEKMVETPKGVRTREMVGTPRGVRTREMAETPRGIRTREMVETPRGGSMQRDEGWVRVQKEKKEEGVEEVIQDPRWDRIKSRFSRMTDTEAGSEKPEVRGWNKQENWGRKTWKESTESTLPKMTGEGVYGVGPVLAALSAGRREFYTLFVQEGLDLSSNNRKKKDKKGFEKVLRIAQKIGLTVKETEKHTLNMLVDNRPHQGLLLDASPLEMIKIQELEPVSVEGEKGPLWIALDEVTDPQNLGAIIRSSYFFGAAGVVLCAKNSAPLSGVVSKASAGSLELMELRSCKNMMQFLTSSADNGWRVLGGSVSSRAIPLNEVPSGAPTILVLGSEGTGLRPLVERSCTQLIRIPGNIPEEISAGGVEDEKVEELVDRGCSSEEFQSFMAVESLNVSVAAGVLLHHLVGNIESAPLGDNCT